MFVKLDRLKKINWRENAKVRKWAVRAHSLEKFGKKWKEDENQ